MSLLPSPPSQTSLVELDDTRERRVPFYISKAWLLWLFAWIDRLQAAFQLLKVVTLTNQGASIGATAVPLGSVSSGLLRVAYYARVTTRDPVSSSLTVTIGWTEGAVSLAFTGAAMTGNLTTTVQSGVMEIQVDANSAITYATAYVSNTPGSMKYSLRVSVTRVS